MKLPRRNFLSLVAGAAVLPAASCVARAQGAVRIEQFDPELDQIISTSEPIREIADGFGGPLGPAEGPVWWREGGYLLLSDINASRRMKYTPGQGVRVFQEKTNRVSGGTRDLQSRLLGCEQKTGRLSARNMTAVSP